jgi:hypothetical protein
MVLGKPNDIKDNERKRLPRELKRHQGGGSWRSQALKIPRGKLCVFFEPFRARATHVVCLGSISQGG